MSNSAANKKKITETYRHQINILRALSKATAVAAGTKLVQLEDIAELSGLKDERETQRFLYILEGQKLVAPHPAGDFTSRHWQITTDGIKALKSIATSPAAN